MNATISRLERPPVPERPCPLARPTHLVDLLARKDDSAVDDPRDEGRQLLGRDGDHRLVQEREPFAYLAVPDQHVALLVDREREQIAIAESLADANCLLRYGGCGGEVSGGLVLEHRRQEQVPALGAVALRPRRAVARGRASRSRGRSHLATRG